jgi:hypothetical protein
MNQTFPSSAYYDAPIAPKASGFLNVLTILTIIGASFGILGSVGNYVYKKSELFKKAQLKSELAKKQFNDGNTNAPKGIVNLFNYILEADNVQTKNIGFVTIVTVISSLLCILEAIFMRKLKKTGFFMYMLGEWAPGILLIILLYNVVGGGIYIGLELIAPVLFTILYATRYKELVH